MPAKNVFELRMDWNGLFCLFYYAEGGDLTRRNPGISSSEFNGLRWGQMTDHMVISGKKRSQPDPADKDITTKPAMHSITERQWLWIWMDLVLRSEGQRERDLPPLFLLFIIIIITWHGRRQRVYTRFSGDKISRPLLADLKGWKRRQTEFNCVPPFGGNPNCTGGACQACYTCWSCPTVSWDLPNEKCVEHLDI